MTVQMSLTTDGSLLCVTTHGPSGVKLTTDAPLDNGGKGSSFSPTDLVGAALLSCMVTTMALAAARQKVPWGAASGTVEKVMSTEAPRRVAALNVSITMPKELPAEQRAHFEHVAHGCPVQRTLSTETKVTLSFVY